MKNRRLYEFSKSKKTVIFSGAFIIVLVAVTLLLDFIVFSESGNVNDDILSAFTSSFIVLTLSVLLITVLNLRVTRKREKDTEKRLQISDTLINCITVLAEEKDINKAIDALLKILNDSFDGDRAYLFEFDYKNQVTNNSYEYAAEGVSKEIDNLQNIPLSVIDSWIRKFEETGTFYISSLDKDVDKDSDTYRILDMQQIQSLIAVPLIENQQIIGFLGIDNPKMNYDDLSLLSSASYFILDSIDRRESHAKLHRLSFEDSLTAVYNRNKFNHDIDAVSGQTLTEIGVAYFDMNGLKEVNDNQGHHVGDEMVKKTAEGIDRVFRGATYRIGGDEFVVITYPVDEKAFRDKVAEAEEILREVGISVSVGISWAEKCENIEEQLTVADSLMYDNKIKYYKMNDRRANK